MFASYYCKKLSRYLKNRPIEFRKKSDPDPSLVERISECKQRARYHVKYI